MMMNKLSKLVLKVLIGTAILGVVAFLLAGRILLSNNQYFVVFLSIIALMMTTIWLIGQKLIIKPLHELLVSVKEFGSGNLDKRIKTVGNDEISLLSKEFNKMAQRVQQSHEDLISEIGNKNKEIEMAKSELEDQGLAILNVLEDVSEEKEYESLRSKSLLETVKEGIVIVNDRGEVEYINPAFESLLGYSESFLKGKILADSLEIFDLLDNQLPPSALSSSAIITKDGDENKLQIMSKEKKMFAVSISAAPIYQANVFKGVVMVFHDFSKDLDLIKQKDDFFSIASHELRTPLTVISGNLDMVLDGIGGSKLTTEDRGMLNDTLESSDRLIRMISDFLNVSRLDQGRLVLHHDEIDIQKLITQIGQSFQSLAEKKGLKLVVNCPTKKIIKVEGDEDKLREVIVNLLGNSLKFTQKGSITIEAIEKDDMLEVRVIDTGMGIPNDNRDLLFHRFQQAMSRTLAREAGGTGLGLYISKEFVKLMGGDLYLVSSTEGKGSIFAFTIPLVKKNN